MVSVTVRRPQFDKRHLYGYNIKEFDTYHGEIIDTPKWVAYEAVCLTCPPGTGMPFRVIPRNEIVSIGDELVEHKPAAEKPRTVTIKGSKGDTYIVTVNNNSYNCTCSGFQFRKSCRHIAEVRAHG